MELLARWRKQAHGEGVDREDVVEIRELEHPWQTSLFP